MKIGILTFYREINFGANLQGLSTYMYLKKSGHIPFMINYYSHKKTKLYKMRMDNEVQPHSHKRFVDEFFKNETEVCYNSNDINNVIEKYGLEAVVVGSDAVLQNHPLINRIKFSSRKIIRIVRSLPDTQYPNPFWGCGINSQVKMSMMSVSSQDSEFYNYSEKLRDKMRQSLSRFSYLSVRDSWTRDMVASIMQKDNRDIPVTPDPVFAFNQNCSEFIVSKDDIIKKYKLPERYVLISLFGQHLSYDVLCELKSLFDSSDIACVALPVQIGLLFKHPFDYEIPVPLSPIDWYSLIKYSCGYIGNNMHPVVCALHNAVPCYSIDFYGTTDFWGRAKKESSSKILHILKEFGIESNYSRVIRGVCKISANSIYKAILSFPINKVSIISEQKYELYVSMMGNIMRSFI